MFGNCLEALPTLDNLKPYSPFKCFRPTDINLHLKSAEGWFLGINSHIIFFLLPRAKVETGNRKITHCSLQPCRFLALYHRPLNEGFSHVQMSPRRLCASCMGSRLYILCLQYICPAKGTFRSFGVKASLVLPYLQLFLTSFCICPS